MGEKTTSKYATLCPPRTYGFCNWPESAPIGPNGSQWFRFVPFGSVWFRIGPFRPVWFPNRVLRAERFSLVTDYRPLREADADGHVPDVHHLFAIHADDRGIDRSFTQTGKFRSVVAAESYADWLACRYGRSDRDVHQHPAGGNVHTSGGVFTLGWAVVELHSYREWMSAMIPSFRWCLLIHRKCPLATGESPWRQYQQKTPTCKFYTKSPASASVTKE